MSEAIVRLRDVVEINPATRVSDAFEKEVCFAAMADVSEAGRITNFQTRPLLEVSKGYTVFSRGDVLLAKITPCFENGKAAVVEHLTSSVGFGSTEFHVLRPSSKIDARFLFHLVWNHRFRRLGSARMTGSAGQKRVPTAFLADYEFRLPQLAEQQRIVAILDKADSLRRKRQESIRLEDDFLRAVFNDMFGDPVRGDRKWSTFLVGDLVKTIEAGWSAPSTDSTLQDGDLGVLKVSAVSTGWFLREEAKAVDKNVVDRPLVMPRRGDLLFSRANTRELVAACCLVEEDVHDRFLPDKLWRIGARNEAATNEFLCFLFRHPSFRHELTKQATGTSGSMLNLSQAKLLQTSAPCPPIELQEHFSSIVKKAYLVRKKATESLTAITSLSSGLTSQLLG